MSPDNVAEKHSSADIFTGGNVSSEPDGVDNFERFREGSYCGPLERVLSTRDVGGKLDLVQRWAL